MAEINPSSRPVKGHEQSDIRIEALVKMGLGVAVAAVAIHLLLYEVLFLYERAARERDRSAVRSAVEQARATPPEPRIQGVPGFHPNVPRRDLEELRANDRRLLSSYGPTGEEGVVRIPIDRAMDLLLERGLPQRKAASSERK